MRELRLKYFLELVSNVGSKARSEGQQLEQAQQRMAQSIDRTDRSIRGMESAYMRFANNASLDRQISYMQRLGQAVDSVTARMERLGSTAVKVGRAGASAFAAFQAGKAVVQEPLAQQRSYERQLADTANVAYAGKDVAGKRAGMSELDKAVRESTRQGGGKREDALGALNDMIASGVVTNEQAVKVLPTIMKYSTAGNAQPGVIANLATKLLQSGFTAEDVPVLLDKALVAGQAGGFELKDMAKWLPQLIASGNQAGLTGLRGYEKILAAAQASVTTAGTKDEAGNNLKDLLSHISSHALKTSAKRMGIDAVGMLTTSMGKGEDVLSGVVSLTDYIIAKDAKASALQKKIDAGTKLDAQGKPMVSEEQMALMRDQAKLLEGSAIGNLFHNQQSLLALVALRTQRKYVQDVLGQVGGAHGQYGADNFSLIAGTNDFKTQQNDNEKLFAQTDALTSVNAALGKLSEGTTYLYRKFPELATVTEGAKLAVGALAAAAAGAATALAVLGLMGAKNDGGLGLPGSRGGGLPGGAGSPGAYPILEGAGGAAAGSAAMAAGVVGGLAVVGAGLTLGVTNMLRNNSAARSAMMNDYGSDSAFAAAILSANDPVDLPDNWRGKGYRDPRLLSLTAPSIAEQTLAAGQTAKVELGEGVIRVEVSTAPGTDATFSVQQQMPGIRLSGGNTNPGSN